MSELIEPHMLYLRAAKKSRATISARRYVLSAMDRALPRGLDDVYPEELAAYFANDDWRGWTPATYYNHANGFYAWASVGPDPWLTYNPMVGLARPRPVRTLPDPVTDDELGRALRLSPAGWRLVILLAAYAGLRRSEIADLDRADVTEERIRVRLGKGGKTADVDTHPAIWAAVVERPIMHPHRLVVTRARGVPISGHRLGMLARAHFNSLGMPAVHLHRFRHWYGTAMLREMRRRGNVDPFALKEAMRHESIQTTLLYLAIENGQRRLAIHTLPVLGDAPSQMSA